jgi:hypothetical protein
MNTDDTTPSSGIDPDLFAEAVIVGTAILDKMSSPDFAKWSAAMLRIFGDKLRPMLRDVWMESNKVLATRRLEDPEPVRHVSGMWTQPKRP